MKYMKGKIGRKSWNLQPILRLIFQYRRNICKYEIGCKFQDLRSILWLFFNENGIYERPNQSQICDRFSTLRKYYALPNRSQTINVFKSLIPKLEPLFFLPLHFFSSSLSPTSPHHLHHTTTAPTTAATTTAKRGSPPSWFSSTIFLVSLFFFNILDIFFL